MARLLDVGDPHAKLNNLAELESLVEFVCRACDEHGVDAVVLFGDLFDTHSVVRLEILEKWFELVNRLSQHAAVILMEGNHDQPGNAELEGKISAIKVLGRMLQGSERAIITADRPTSVFGMLVLPYTRSQDKFVGWCRDAFEKGIEKTVLCHQSFDGSKFSSGIYDPEGFDQSLVPQELIISGHIHDAQEFGKVFHVGTPKWEDALDASKEKGVWIMDVDETTGQVDRASMKFLPTAGAVTPLRKIVLMEGDEDPALLEGSEYLIELVGTSKWIGEAKRRLQGRARIKSTFTDAKAKARSAGKTYSTMGEYLDEFAPVEGVTREDLRKYSKGAA